MKRQHFLNIKIHTQTRPLIDDLVYELEKKNANPDRRIMICEAIHAAVLEALKNRERRRISGHRHRK